MQTRKASIPIFAASASAALVPALAQGQYGSGLPMMWWGGGWFGMILGPLIMILMLVAAPPAR
jgi:putative membrane protein